jgi:DNA-binding response OmpR family regulator
MNILVVEDDLNFGKALQVALADFGNVETACSIESALCFKDSTLFDLIITDYFLPDGNGMALIEGYRVKNPEIKSILISGGATKEIAIDCIKFKVNDILEKPFGSRELCESVEKLFKTFEFKLDAKQSVLQLKDQKFNLTSTEYKIVEVLIQNCHRRISRQEICRLIWGEATISDNVFDTHLGNLKKKLGDLSVAITNIKGIGYALDSSKIA